MTRLTNHLNKRSNKKVRVNKIAKSLFIQNQFCAIRNADLFEHAN